MTESNPYEFDPCAEVETSDQLGQSQPSDSPEVNYEFEEMDVPPESAGESPTLLPPQEDSSGGIAAWHKNKRITMVWSNNQKRNSWVYVSGIGWKKLADNQDSAVMALTILGSHARHGNSPVNYREEKGQIRELYVL